MTISISPGCRGRRHFLQWSAALGVAFLLPRPVRAAQVRTLEGKVTVNGKPVKVTTPIRPGDVVVTGPKAKLVFVVGEDAFLLRQNSRLSLDKAAGSSLVTGLRVLTGALLAVFGQGPRRLVTSTATIGIRGTGVYLQVTRTQTYLCACYGDLEVRDAKGKERRRLISGYHTPTMIYARLHAGKMMADAEVKDHTDQELIMLESLVGRVSPVLKREQRLREGAAAQREAAMPPEEPAVSKQVPAAQQPSAAPTASKTDSAPAARSKPEKLEWRLPPPRQ